MSRLVPRKSYQPSSPPKLLDRVRETLRRKHYSYRTEQAYVNWIKRYITHLAVNENVASSTQNQVLSALLFLYREVFRQELGPIDALRAKKPKRLPTVLTKNEVHRLLNHLSGIYRLMAQLLYGSGLRLMECLRLRVKDLDFTRRTITVRDGKG
ncbi:phage integrase N-terminal SAM-like domain-containing protein [Candidatus Poribacteria bacterium]|nr:phage integrase N-terminal SAM-like domain-containing protein [Candidatus Poribacteria bacterium]